MLNSQFGVSQKLREKAAGIGSALRLAGLAVVVAVISSCSSVHDIVPDSVSSILPGKVDEKERLTGERRAVLQKSQSLGAEGDVSDVPVNIPAAFVNANWTQPGGRASNAFEHLAMNSRPKRIWNVSAGNGSSSSGRLTASPIVVGDYIFVLDTRATVHAFSTSNGSAIWSMALTPENEEDDEGFGGGLAASDNLLYVATGFGTVSAHDMTTGAKKWTKSLGVPVRSSPTAHNGKVYVTTVNNEVFALNSADGETVWKFRGVSESAGLLGNTSPAVADGFVVVPYTSGDLVTFGELDGAPVWTDSLSKTGRLSSLAQLNDIAGRPVIYDSKVYAVSHGGRFAALSLSSGERLWEKDISGVQTPWVAGNYIFVVNLDNQVMALERNTGKVRWITSLNNVVKSDKSRGQWSGPVLAGGNLWMVSSKGNVVLMSPQDGSTKATFSLGENLFITPIIANKTIYFYTDSANLIAMR